MANAPLSGTGWAELLDLICPTGEAKYFFEDIWTGQITLIRFDKLVFTRKGFSAKFLCRRSL
jgi:hypothetical protein